MKKRIVSLLAAMLLFLSAAASVWAAGYVADDTGSLTAEEISELSQEAEAVAGTYGVTAAISVSKDCEGKNIADYAADRAKAEQLGKDSVLLVVDEKTQEYYFQLSGAADGYFGDADLKALWNAYNSKDTYYDGVKAYLKIADEKLKAAGVQSAGSSSPAKTIPEKRLLPLLVDNAKLLSADESSALLAKLGEISERQKCDIAVVTVTSLDGKEIKEYAQDFYDYNGYGYGKNHDGALLLILLDGSDRKRYLVTTGFGITAFTDEGIQYILDETRSDMSDGNYSAAFASYADLCDKFITQARTGTPYDVGNMPKGPFHAVGAFFISLGIGVVISLIFMAVEKSKCKNVEFRSSAHGYMRPDSLNISHSQDLFLYSNVSRTERSSSNNSGGSSTSVGSSGTSHGGGGDSF